MIIYPPYIGDIIPAFTPDKIIIPFSQNPAVGINEITGFSLRVQEYGEENIVFATLTTNNLNQQLNYDYNTNSGTITFPLDEENFSFLPKQYYKFQLSYLDNEAIANSYSIVSIGRCIDVPEHSFIGLEPHNINRNLRHYTVEYKTTITSEPIYSYRFYLQDTWTNEIIQDSGELIYNSSNDNIIDNTRISKLEFDIDQILRNDKYYKIVNIITTVNGYQSTIFHNVIEAGGLPMQYNLSLLAYQDHIAKDNGFVYIKINTTETQQKGKFILERTSDLIHWDELNKFELSPNTKLNGFCWKDLSVEAGTTYYYSVTQYGNTQFGDIYYSERKISNPVYVDFEDMFLSDGEKQLKIKYNPKISSFKETLLETKTNTIGGKYPFFFRNNIVRYKEIPISGLISYQMDEVEMFMTDEELGFNNNLIGRKETAAANTTLIGRQTNLTLENITAERIFKLAVLEWLNNGKPKLFRSPAEGNYVVRLMDTSLSPNDTLSRMLHTFSSTGCECANFDIKTLKDKNLFKLEELPVLQDELKTYSFEYTATEEIETLELEDMFGENITFKSITNIKWVSTANVDTEYLTLDGKPYYNTSGLFITPSDITFTDLSITHKLSGTISFTAEVEENNDDIDAFNNMVANSHDIIQTFGTNQEGLLNFGEDITIYKIYALAVQRSLGATDGFMLKIGDNEIDCSDGQIRFYTDLPSTIIEKERGLVVDLYARVEGLGSSSKLGKFTLGYSIIGQEEDIN